MVVDTSEWPDAVRLCVRANDSGGKRVVRIAGDEFIGRLLQHVLPSGFKRIRHYGLLAPQRSPMPEAKRAAVSRGPP